MSGSYAHVIADSVSAVDGVRLTTFEIRFRRFVLAEFNTHRVLSRNSASSRAIPFDKQVERMIEDLAYPETWPREQKGMQGGESLTTQARVEAEMIWAEASRDAIEQATKMRHLGRQGEVRLHKSVVNRMLEPYMWHTVVATGTAWENYFDQRCSPLAQPEIRVAADMMRRARDASTPKVLEPGQWHLPYVDEEEVQVIADQANRRSDSYREAGSMARQTMASISASRCAQLSYLTQPVTDEDGHLLHPGGIVDRGKDLARYQSLTTADPPHWSPLEHPATPWPENRQNQRPLSWDFAGGVSVGTDHLPRVGNLLGWRSLRTTVEAEQRVVTFR